MKFKIIMLMLILVAAMMAPYFIKGRDGQSLFNLAEPDKGTESTNSTRQMYYKWQDENGSWHFGDNPPEGVTLHPVSVDTAANVIQSVKINRPEEQQRSTNTAPTTPGLPVPLTVDPTQVEQMIEDAENVQQLLDDRQKQLDDLTSPSSNSRFER